MDIDELIQELETIQAKRHQLINALRDIAKQHPERFEEVELRKLNHFVSDLSTLRLARLYKRVQ